MLLLNVNASIINLTVLVGETGAPNEEGVDDDVGIYGSENVVVSL